jgi:hypothetical protein
MSRDRRDKKRRFTLTYQDGQEWAAPVSTWKDVALFITEWERWQKTDDVPRRVVKIEVDFPPCKECGRCD